MEESNPELESFRRKWREEVSARALGGSKSSETKSSSSRSLKHSKAPLPPPFSTSQPLKDEDEEPDGSSYHDIEDKDDDRRLDSQKHPAGEAASKEPSSALEHYEKAVDKETQGKLGDSLNLYRKAFRMDPRVDQSYKNKYFPPSSFKPKSAEKKPISNAPTASAQASGAPQDLPPTISELISSFAELAIPTEPPPTDSSPPPPCPIANLPNEILVNILQELAVLDIASFARLAQVCKRFAFLVATEEQIWKRVCCGYEFGFPAMQYDWACNMLGGPLGDDGEGGHILGVDDDPIVREPGVTSLENDPPSLELLHSSYSSSWRRMFSLRPRIRFNGCYISTVNYLRPGYSSPTQITWNTPVHIVTYYRYLRFFRDGTAISLLTAVEPSDVVHHLTKEHIHRHHSGGLPSSVMQGALRGRWRMNGPGSDPDRSDEEEEGDVRVETEGVDPKYMYSMLLTLRSAGRGAKNNKLVWKGFWSYNKLTDDWGEFTLRNDKAFYWSRVKSYNPWE